jgi:hypothetical protein
MMQVPPALAGIQAVLERCHVADVRFFTRRPDRRHRVRLAAHAELALARHVAGITEPVPAGIRAFVAIKRGSAGWHHRVIGFRHETADTDVSEAEAAEAYADFRAHDNAKLRRLAASASHGGAIS